MVKYASKILDRGMFAAVPTDKDVGFVLTNKFTLKDFIVETLSNLKVYTKMPWTWRLVQDVCEEYSSVVREVTSISLGTEDMSLRRELTSGYQYTPEEKLSNMLVTFKCTIKTHNPRGKVVPRPIRACVGIPLRPAMRWISWV